jgi:hypothetical protein
VFDGPEWCQGHAVKGPVLLALAAFATGDVPHGWVSHPGPEPRFEGSRYCANYSHPGWQVSIVEGALRVDKASPRGRDRAIEVDLPQGRLVGSNEGEWGGSLTWYPPGQKTGRDIIEENVLAVIAGGSRPATLVFTGLAHLGTDYGRVFSITFARNKPVVNKVAEIGSQPRVIQQQPDGSVLILTRHGLLRLQPGGRLENLCSADFQFLNVNSLAATAKDEVYVGMGLFISRLSLLPSGSCEVNWFVREDCQKFRVEGPSCVCTP